VAVGVAPTVPDVIRIGGRHCGKVNRRHGKLPFRLAIKCVAEEKSHPILAA
jgi:hypothetical protein